MKELLKTLCTAYGATGRENAVAEVIKNIVAPYVDEITTDALGNLICTKKGSGKRIMLAAHMDHIGFVVCDIDEKGFIRVVNVGGIRKVYSLNRHVVFENGVSGVLSFEQREHDLMENGLNKMFIDIGATSREEAEKMVEIGDVAVYAPDVFEVGENCLAGPAMDDRAGCAILVETLRRLPADCENEVVVVFTTQEEVGLRGARAAAYSVEPDVGIALDVTHSGDTPKGPMFPMALHKGAAIKVLDSSVICHPGVVAKLEAVAQEKGIAHQREVLTGGGTDTAAIQATRGGIPSGAISIPTRYIHSAAEMVSISDLDACADLLAAYCTEKTLY